MLHQGTELDARASPQEVLEDARVIEAYLGQRYASGCASQGAVADA